MFIHLTTQFKRITDLLSITYLYKGVGSCLKYINKCVLENVGVIVFVLFTTAILYPIWGFQGWPENHEANAIFLRTQIYSEHFRKYDFFPIWSNQDNMGFGSAQPLFYHKLFYYVSGVLTVISGDLKLAVTLGIGFFSIMGAVGMYAVVQLLTRDKLLAVAAGISIICAKYSITNWLVRGAVAEYSAAMLVPWLLYYYIRSITEKRIVPFVGVVLGVLFLGHSTLAYYLGLILSVTTVLLIALRQLPIKFILSSPCVLSIMGFVLVTGGYLLGMLNMGVEYDMRRLITDYYQPDTHTQPLIRYLWDTYWNFGKTAGGLSVQLDSPPLLVLLFCSLSLALQKLRTIALNRVNVDVGIVDGEGSQCRLIKRFCRQGMPTSRALGGDSVCHPWHLDSGNPCRNAGVGGLTKQYGGITRATHIGLTVLPLVLIACIVSFLQSPYAHYFYYHFPGAIFIQFPWRLLAVLTPVLIILALCATQTLNQRLRDLVVGGYLVSMVVLCGAFVPLQYARFPVEKHYIGTLSFSWFGEYIPSRAGTSVYSKNTVLGSAKDAHCLLKALATIKEAEPVRFYADCQNPTAITLPLYYSALHRVMLTSPRRGLASLACEESAKYPGLCAVSLPSGVSNISVLPPSLGSVLLDSVGLLP